MEALIGGRKHAARTQDKVVWVQIKTSRLYRGFPKLSFLSYKTRFPRENKKTKPERGDTIEISRPSRCSRPRRTEEDQLGSDGVGAHNFGHVGRRAAIGAF